MIVAATLYIATMEEAQAAATQPVEDTIEELLDLDAKVPAATPQREVSAAVTVVEGAGAKEDDVPPPPGETQNVLDFIKN